MTRAPNQLPAFTLVETLVAITIMTLAILAPFEAIQRVTLEARIAQEQLTASALAQEGLEFVRFMRTSNYLYAYEHGLLGSYDPMGGLDGKNPSGLFGLADCESTKSNKCTVDASGAVNYPTAIVQCGATCNPLWVRTSGSYTQSNASGNPTPYTRSLTVKINAGYETATVTVSWIDHGAQSITLSENFYDWL